MNKNKKNKIAILFLSSLITVSAVAIATSATSSNTTIKNKTISLNKTLNIASNFSKSEAVTNNVLTLLPNRRDYFLYDFVGKTKEKEFDKLGGRGYVTAINNAEITSEFVNITGEVHYAKLNGGNSNIELPLSLLGYNNSLKFRVKREKIDTEQNEEILFSASSENNNFSIKAKQVGTGKFGFSKNGMNFSFDYELPIDQWVDIELRNPNTDSNPGTVKLYTGNKVYEIIKENATDAQPLSETEKPNSVNVANNTESKEAFMFPLKFIGSKTNSFKGKITNLRAEPLNTTVDSKDPNYLNPIVRSTEVKRLEQIKLRIRNDEVEDSSKLEDNNIKINGVTAKEILEWSWVPVENDLRYIIVKTTLTSKDPSTLFSKDYHLTLNTPLSSFLTNLIGLKTIESDYIMYTEESVKEHIIEVEKFIKKANMLQTATEEKINELRKEYQKVNIELLITFEQDLNNKVKMFRDKNSLIFTSKSYDNAKKKVNDLEAEFQKINKKLNRSNHKGFVEKLDDIVKELKTNKEMILETISQAKTQIEKKFHTKESVAKFENEINKIKNDIDKENELLLDKYEDFNQKIKLIKPPVTYKSELEKKLKNFEKTINFDNVKEEKKNAFNKTINEVNGVIKKSPQIDEMTYITLNKKLDSAHDDLFGVVRSSGWKIAGIVLGSLVIVIGIILILYFTVLRRRKLKNKK